MNSIYIDRTKKYLQIAAVAFLLIILGTELSRMIVACGTKYPRELREAADVYLTQQIFEGINPYKIENVNYGNAYVYGPINSLIAAGVMRLTGITALKSLHCLSVFWYCVLILLVSGEVWYYTRNSLWTVSAGVVSLSCCYRLGFVTTVPDSMGLVLGCVILMIVNHMDSRTKWYHILGLDLLAIMTFYVKPYFILFALVSFIGVLLKSKKKAFLYALCGVLMGIGSLLLASVYCPLLTINMIYFEFVENVTTKIAEDDFNYTLYSLNQMKVVIYRYSFYIIFTIIGIIRGIIGFFANRINSRENSVSLHIGIRNIYVVQILISFFLLIYLGTNTGAYLSYHLQLFCPYIIIVGSVECNYILKRFCPDSMDSIKKNLVITLIVICVGVNIWSTRCVAYINTAQEDMEWEKLYGVLARYADKEKMYLGPTCAVWAIENGFSIYDTGQGYYGSDKLLKVDVEPYTIFFPQIDDLQQLAIEMQEQLDRQVKEHEFTLIAGSSIEECYNDELGSFYREIEDVLVRTGIQEWKVKVSIVNN